MLSQSDVQQLRQLLETEAQNSAFILGARIGGIVKKHFPDFSIKNEFGSLGKFINTHFADLMVFHGKQGNDNEYEFTAQTLANLTDKLDPITLPENTTENLSNNAPARKLAIAQKRYSNTEQPQPHADTILRQAIKNAIDIMTPEQLRQLVLPAGILFDAISKATR